MAVILAGGEGRRLRPFSFTTPKALLPLATRPMLEHLLFDLAAESFAELAISGAADLEERYLAAGGRLPTGVRLRWLTAAASPLASLAAAWTAKDWPLLAVPANLVMGEAGVYRKVAAMLEDGSAQGVSVTGQMSAVEPSLVGARPLGLFGLPPSARPGLARGGELEALAARRTDFRAMDLGERAPLIGTNTLSDERAAKAKAAWVMVERPHDLLDAHYVVLSRMATRLRGRKIAKTATVAPSVVCKGPVSVAKGARIGADVQLGHFVWIGEDARIEHGAVLGDYTVIGPRGRVGPGAKFYGVMGAASQMGRCAEFGGMLMEEVSFPHASHLAGILGNRVKISVGIVTGTLKLIDPPFRMFIAGKAERTHLAGVAIGDDSFIGAGALLMGGVRIGPYSVVGPGVLVQRDVPPNKLVTRKEEVAWRDIHPENPIQVAAGEYPPLWHRNQCPPVIPPDLPRETCTV
jgi:bifunctional UDP-N-acetylglucosamine pyrophosphorylase/glucosamine-1-phosphate N-acetyltransferase